MEEPETRAFAHTRSNMAIILTDHLEQWTREKAERDNERLVQLYAERLREREEGLLIVHKPTR